MMGQTGQVKADIPPPGSGKVRWVVCLLLFFATSINYIDRQIIGLLKPVLEKQFNWSESDYGLMITAFTAAYAGGQLIFGGLIDRIGTRLGLAWSMIIWSLSAMAHALVRSTLGFMTVRISLGLGEAGNFPASIRAVAEWFPRSERALATGIFNSGSNAGAVLAPVIVPLIFGIYGWKAAFLATGAVGFIWLLFWLIFYEIPARQHRLGTAENTFIHGDGEDIEPAPAGSWFGLLKLRKTWAFISGKFLTDPVWYFFLFWLPSYFNTTFHLDLKKPSLPLVIVYSATTLGSIGGGYISSRLIRQGVPAARARKVTMFYIALAVVPVIGARFTTSLWVIVALISLAAAAHQAWSANIFTTVSDSFPRHSVSSVIGLGGMAGATGGALFPLLIGAILDYFKSRHDLISGYNLLFTIAGFAYLFAWVIMHLLSKRRESDRPGAGISLPEGGRASSL